MGMRRPVLLFMVFLAAPYFSALPHKRHDCWKKLLNIKRVFWSSVPLLPGNVPIKRRIQRDTIINVHRSSREYSLFLSHFNGTYVFSIDLRHILKYSFIKVQQAELRITSS
jgi:hypothetical protein